VHGRVTIAIFAFGLVSTSFGGNDAAVVGVVRLPPPTLERPLDQRYQTSESVVVPINPPAAVVYLEGDFAAPAALAVKTTAEMSQKNVQFSPDLVAVRVGSAVTFPNLDDTYHNVFSYSRTKRFDLGRYRRDERPGTVVFDKPGLVTVHCEIHDRMRGTILVLETPYFQKTDTTGRFQLDHLPAGHFLLKAWVSEADVRQQPVDLKSGTTLRVDFRGR
jgi:plastocyanin